MAGNNKEREVAPSMIQTCKTIEVQTKNQQILIRLRTAVKSSLTQCGS